MRVFFQQVTEAANRTNADPGGLELAPQPMDVDLDRVRADFFVPAVQLLRELFFVDDPSASHHQHFEHTELARRKIERLARKRGAAACSVEYEQAVREYRGAA